MATVGRMVLDVVEELAKTRVPAPGPGYVELAPVVRALYRLGIWDAEVLEGYTAFHGAFKGVVFLDLAEWPPEMPKGTTVRVVLLPKEEK